MKYELTKNTKRYRPQRAADVYGSYDTYNFYKIYQKHNPLHVRVSSVSGQFARTLKELSQDPTDRTGTMTTSTFMISRGPRPRRLPG